MVQPYLRCLSSDCSDHSPLLLQLCTQPWAKTRFRFESFWTRLDGFHEAVAAAWDSDLPVADPCRVLDFKLRMTAKSLQIELEYEMHWQCALPTIHGTRAHRPL